VIRQREAVLTTQAGPGHPATSAAAFAAVEADLTGAISADQAAFTADPPHGRIPLSAEL
jgi:hypothetical protein